MNRIFCRVARVSFAVVVAAQALLNAQVTTYRINCGATFAYQDPSGYAWTYDGWPQPAFISSSSGTVSDQAYWNFGIPPPQISYTTSDPIYWAAKTVGGFPGAYMEYQFQVPNGYYGVRLKFVEIDPNVAVGGRRFNVDLNGSNVLTLFDILAAAGDRNRAIDKEYPVTVTDGNIRIRLTAIVSNAVISGIEILPVIGSAFADVPPTHLHHATVQFMRDKFITSGCATVHYCPDRSLTRGEMAVFLVRAIYWAITGNVEGAPTLTDPGFTYSSTPYFTDVPMDHPFFKYIQEIKELRVTSGTTATTYDPNRVLTVGEVAAFTVHALEFLEKGKVLALDHPDRNEYVVAGQWCFSDVPPGHIWYKIFGRIHQLGVMTGNCVTYGSATPNVSSGEAGDVLRGLMSRFVAIGIDKQGSTGTGGGGGGGSTSSAVR
ncbi:MAG: S-layer homology domain-containing protein, partial [Bryobacterales bacterium]|nr:S-layer homology domain-containing protein [Bryobacterales bacterium]